ncbi:MAG TPA: hypothetical protein VKK31_07665 [Thermoanaerobaculia bacterium]|nr:hypothetical protein [Thermoanaerobaculia bacterium]
METMQAVMTQIRIELKSERVQETLAADDTAASFVLDLAIAQQQHPVTIELAEPKVTITLYGYSAEAG